MMQTELLPIGDVDVGQTGGRGGRGRAFHFVERTYLEEAGISNNPTDRCYLCKKTIFAKMKAEAEKRGISVLLEGTDADDLLAYRPGIPAIRELGIKGPPGRGGGDQKRSKGHGRGVWHCRIGGPAFRSPCMATRFPYGAELTLEQLNRVKEGEEYLKGFGTLQCTPADPWECGQDRGGRFCHG